VPPRSLVDRLIQSTTPRVVAGFSPSPVEVAPGVWTVERRIAMPGGPSLPACATVIRLPSRGLLVVSPPPLSAGGLEALEALGPVEEILAPNSFHHLNARDFLARHPSATFRFAPGLRARVSALPPGEELATAAPPPWGGAVEHTILGPVRGLAEVALFHRPSATLILTDVAFNLVNAGSRVQRLLLTLLGVPRGFGPSRTARMLLLRDRPLAAAFLTRVLEWPFQRVLVAHGQPLEADAQQVFRAAFSAYLPSPVPAQRR
jgi:hypothetical protein